eukprot:3180568-Rhodomonas_salina.1
MVACRSCSCSLALVHARKLRARSLSLSLSRSLALSLSLSRSPSPCFHSLRSLVSTTDAAALHARASERSRQRVGADGADARSAFRGSRLLFFLNKVDERHSSTRGSDVLLTCSRSDMLEG